jgi:hypothetical protein
MLSKLKGVQNSKKVSKANPGSSDSQGIKYDSKRHLILKGPSKNFKFCRICGYKTRASTDLM